MNNLKHVFEKLDSYCAEQDFAGWDPFDALNSKAFRASGMNCSSFLRLCWLQLFKRLPINLRALTLTPKASNAKAVSLFLRSAILQGDEPRMRVLFDRLMDTRVNADAWGAAAWGYPFDWQAKAFFVSTETPNVICTAYAVRALRELQKVRPDWLDEGVFSDAAQFVKQHLAKPEGYIAYVPGSDALVYNASLWGAYICQQGGEGEIAKAAIDNTLAAQGSDGSWIYGTASHHGFIDGFHTGYNLEALHLINEGLLREDIAHAIERGMEFYLEHCFEADGLPKYYADNLYPIDPHAAAQGVLTLLTLDAPRYRERAQQIAEAIVREMWDEKRGSFYYQKHSKYTNRIAYMRWTQSWMHLALVSLIKG